MEVEFKTTGERDRWLSNAFPGRRALSAPGCYGARGFIVQVCGRKVAYGREG